MVRMHGAAPRPLIRTAASTLAAAALTVALGAPALAHADHRVEPGDTVWNLADRYGSSVEAIMAANALDTRATIRIGQTLAVPTAGEDAAAQPAPAPAARVTVAAGDTVWTLARRHGSTVDAIVAANGLPAGALIRVGQQLVVPGSAVGASVPAPVPAPPAATVVTVAPGDTLSAIAARHRTTVAALVAANGIVDAHLIRDGQRLTVPGGSAEAPTGLVGDTFLGRTYATDVVASANRHKAELLARDVPSRAHMQQLVASTARSLGVDPALAQALAYQESGFNMRAVSPADAVGVMQVIPASGEWASQLAGRPLDLLDPEDNVLAGVLILRSHLRGFESRDDAVGAYYQGAAAVRKRGLHTDTVSYVASINALVGRFS